MYNLIHSAIAVLNTNQLLIFEFLNTADKYTLVLSVHIKFCICINNIRFMQIVRIVHKYYLISE